MAKKPTLVNIKATVNLDKGTVYASKSALRAAKLAPNPKDKGITVPGFTKADGDKVSDYQVYSVLDAVKLDKPVKTTKAKPTESTDLEALQATVAQQSQALEAILAKLEA